MYTFSIHINYDETINHIEFRSQRETKALLASSVLQHIFTMRMNHIRFGLYFAQIIQEW